MRWFKHDSDAGIDVKLKRVRMKYGMEGYGLYWHCLESIARGIDENKFTFELEDDAEIIAHDTGIHHQLVQEMMVFMVNLGLFEEAGGRITCLKMLRRLDQSMISNPKLREVIKTAKQNHDPLAKNHDAIMTASAKPMQEENRIEENRKEYIQPLVDVQQAETSTRGGNKRQKAIPYKQIQDLYNQNFGFNVWARSSSVLTEKTKRQIAKVNKHMESLDDWAGYFGFCSREPWINGTTRDSDWKPDIDYLTREKTHAKMADTLGDTA